MEYNIGITVLCIKSHKLGWYKKGDSFRIQGMREWKCGCMTRILLDIGLSDPNISTHYCTNCNKNDFKDSILWVWSKHFVPTIDSSYVEYIEVNQSENAALN